MTTVDVLVVRVFADASGAFGTPLGIGDGRLVAPLPGLRG
jgi:hypothetical protein